MTAALATGQAAVPGGALASARFDIRPASRSQQFEVTRATTGFTGAQQGGNLQR